MKIEKILLRWYKSFNIRYLFEDPDRNSKLSRPWNSLEVTEKFAEDFPFIEIPVESDITTIVGGNESGKSHLLDALCKVLSGNGPNGEPFSITDICRYRSIPDIEKTTLPNIGVQFTLETTDEVKRFTDSIDMGEVEPGTPVAFVLGGKNADIEARIFIEDQSKLLTAPELIAIRELMPRVQFINANAGLPDNIELAELMAVIKNPETSGKYVPKDPQQLSLIAAAVDNWKIAAANQPIPPDLFNALSKLKQRRTQSESNSSDDARLAATLLVEILGSDPEVLNLILDQPANQRGFIQSFVDDWNVRINEELHLSALWTQDDIIKLELAFQEGTLYFNISDKTNGTYTFSERSSGLRYFLSYLIQAKALEKTDRIRGSFLIMDEPDSFLSINGQKSLLNLFEALVGHSSVSRSSQLIYTTHSPFLINKNFPQRIRVVRKEAAEEGTQFTGRASARRYEPVRSALGIDCAQTLFMGSTNLVLEGLTDQYFVSEMVRLLSEPDSMEKVLDLNAISVISAESVNKISKILASSQWRDEPIPATVVMVDGDLAGQDVAKEIVGEKSGCKKLVDKDAVLVLDSEIDKCFSGQIIETIEDIVPRRLYLKAFKSHVEEWYEEVSKTTEFKSRVKLSKSSLGNVAYIREICNATDGLQEEYDKIAVLHHVVQDLELKFKCEKQTIDQGILIKRMYSVFSKLNGMVEISQERARKQSFDATVKRILREFLLSREENGSNLLDFRRVVDRLSGEIDVSNGLGNILQEHVNLLEVEVKRLSEARHNRISGIDWESIVRLLKSIVKNPSKPPIAKAMTEIDVNRV